jgi:hypothetical protein
MMLLQLGPLLGQVRRQPQPAGPGAGEMAGMLLCYGVVIVVAIIINIFFLLTLSRCLGQCKPRNRTMEPGAVWLNLIPLFGLVWMFITIIRISESLQNEYRYRGMRADDPEFAKMTGILYMVFSFFCGPVALVFFIMYWAKIAGFKNALMSSRGRRRDDIDDDYDDRPRRGRRDDDFDDDDDRPPRDRRRRDDDYDDDDDRPRRRDDY